jgi:hypothetical protein
MTAFLAALQSIGPLFLVIFAGIAVSRTHKSVDEKWIDILNNYALWIGFPALILVALSRLEWDFGLYGKLIAWNSARLVLSIFLVIPISAVLKIKNSTRRTLFLAVSFGNVAYLGIPVLRNAFGDPILPAATMISAVYLVCLFTLAVFMVEFYGDEKIHPAELLLRLVGNPMLIAVFIGLMIAVNHLSVPKIIMSGLDLIANSVTGIVLFSLGLFVGRQSLGNVADWIPVFAFSLIILLVQPLVFYWVSRSFVPVSESRSWILESAMPLGLTPYALSVKYRLDAQFTSRVVVASTLMALISLPLWLVILQ